jgi:hypothetical protein
VAEPVRAIFTHIPPSTITSTPRTIAFFGSRANRTTRPRQSSRATPVIEDAYDAYDPYDDDADAADAAGIEDDELPSDDTAAVATGDVDSCVAGVADDVDDDIDEEP